MSTLYLPAGNFSWIDRPRLLPMGSPGGAHLKELREERGLSLEQVAKKLFGQFQIRISRSALSRYETGSRKTPDALLLWGLSRIYSVPLDDLIVQGLNRRDLTRHSAPPDSPDATATAARHAELAERIDAATKALTDVALALRGEAGPAQHHAPARVRLRRTAH